MKRISAVVACLVVAVGIGVIAYKLTSSEMAGLILGVIALALEMAGLTTHARSAQRRATVSVRDAHNAIVEGIRSPHASENADATIKVRRVSGGQYRGIVESKEPPQDNAPT